MYLKHTVIDLETPNESSSTKFHVLGNYSCDSDFDNFSPHISDMPCAQKSEMLFQLYLLVGTEEIIFYQE